MSERSAVQEPMLRYAAEIGWQPIPQLEAVRLRGGEACFLFTVSVCAQPPVLYHLNQSQFVEVNDKVQHRALGEILTDLTVAWAERERADAGLESVLAKFGLN